MAWRRGAEGRSGGAPARARLSTSGKKSRLGAKIGGQCFILEASPLRRVSRREARGVACGEAPWRRGAQCARSNDETTTRGPFAFGGGVLYLGGVVR